MMNQEQTVGAVVSVTRTEASGWISTHDVSYPEVVLAVNGHTITRTRALDMFSDCVHLPGRAFFFSLRDVWKYIRPGDLITISVNGSALPLAEGQAWAFWGTGERPLSELLIRLAKGWVFDKTGRLQMSKKLDRDWQERVVATYRELKSAMNLHFGHRLYPAYGTLLGAIRESDFIGNDDDLDSVYISSHNGVQQVRNELFDIAHQLILSGFQVSPGLTCLKVTHPKAGGVIDLFHAYFNANDHLIIPFGLAGTEPYMRADLTGTQTANLSAYEIDVPSAPEKWLAWTYGNNWRTPDPNFNWARNCRVKENAALLTPAQRADVHFANQYTHWPTLEPSDTFRAVSDMLASRLVLDLGCGAGADAYAFANLRDDIAVIGVDRVEAGVRAGRSLVDSARPKGRLRFEVANVLDMTVLQDLLHKARRFAREWPTEILVYARHLLDGMAPSDAETVVKGVADALETGDRLIVEMRLFDPRIAEPTLKKSFRRTADLDGLLAVARSSNLTLEHRERMGHPPVDGVIGFERLILRRAASV